MVVVVAVVLQGGLLGDALGSPDDPLRRQRAVLLPEGHMCMYVCVYMYIHIYIYIYIGLNNK